MQQVSGSQMLGSLAYSTSKAAVDHLTNNMALDMASKGIRVNAVNPGLIISEIQKRAGMPDDVYEKVRRVRAGKKSTAGKKKYTDILVI